MIRKMLPRSLPAGVVVSPARAEGYVRAVFIQLQRATTISMQDALKREQARWRKERLVGKKKEGSARICRISTASIAAW
jgi:hypothetical protein